MCSRQVSTIDVTGRVDVNCKRKVQCAPEEWRVVTVEFVARKRSRMVVLLSVWMVVVMVRWGPKRTYGYNMKNNMADVQ